jgi:hypothetical protein
VTKPAHTAILSNRVDENPLESLWGAYNKAAASDSILYDIAGTLVA